MNSVNRIYVYANNEKFQPIQMGILNVDGAKGRQYAPAEKTMFGIFADASPDRWGRLLMKRREAIRAKKEERKPRRLTDVDFLLGVYDETRMGALRFSISENGPFLSNDKELSTPPWTTLRTLEAASLAFEKNEDGMEEKWLRQLLAPGSSLGGARPKASVLAPDGSLWIAKFPSKYDEINIGAWEMVVHELAVQCNLEVPEAKLEKFSKIGSTFLSKRFDREGEKRIQVASAMTLLGKVDGANASDGTSYLDIASFIRRHGATPKKDLHELWRRIVFNMAVSNTDDHLRNHAFILSPEGWILSPLYDVNPNIYGENLSLNVDSNNSMIDFGLALSVAKLFGLSEKQAAKELSEIKYVVDTKWRKLAEEYGLRRREIEDMSPAFDMAFKS